MMFEGVNAVMVLMCGVWLVVMSVVFVLNEVFISIMWL